MQMESTITNATTAHTRKNQAKTHVHVHMHTATHPTMVQTPNVLMCNLFDLCALAYKQTYIHKDSHASKHSTMRGDLSSVS